MHSNFSHALCVEDETSGFLWRIAPPWGSNNMRSHHELFKLSLFGPSPSGPERCESMQQYFRTCFRANPTESDYANQEAQLFALESGTYTIAWSSGQYCIVPTCRFSLLDRIRMYIRSLDALREVHPDEYEHPITGKKGARELLVREMEIRCLSLTPPAVSIRSTHGTSNCLEGGRMRRGRKRVDNVPCPDPCVKRQKVTHQGSD